MESKLIFNKIIIADASPLIVLSRIDQLALIKKMFEEIIIPEEVANECFLNKVRPGAKNIQQAVSDRAINIYNKPINSIPNFNFPTVLGEGEIAAIQLAYQLKAPLLVDDLWGRKIAKKLEVPIIGTAGVLLLAKKQGLILDLPSTFTKIKECGFYISEDLMNKILMEK